MIAVPYSFRDFFYYPLHFTLYLLLFPETALSSIQRPSLIIEERLANSVDEKTM
jgi:hypothetical protein